jgi:hypothetical protein
LVKSFSETHPDFGFASACVDVQRYVDGSAQVWPGEPDPLGELEALGELGELGEAELLDGLGRPLHAVPLSSNPVGAGFDPLHEPLNPKVVLPLVGILLLYPAFVTVTWAPDCVNEPFQSWVTV